MIKHVKEMAEILPKDYILTKTASLCSPIGTEASYR